MLLADGLIILIALLHTWFLTLEMFLWTKPIGLRAFGMTTEEAAKTRTLAANQGLYNGFLVAGLIWSLWAQPELKHPLQLFFISCVFVAGVFGGITVNRKIFFIQGAPALLALILLLIST